MYNDLSSILPDPEKMRDDIERFSWDPKTLKNLIGSRILAYWPNEELEDSSPEQAIDAVFEPGVLDHIISRTLHRPREIIQFCNEVLKAFRKQSVAGVFHSKLRANDNMEGNFPAKIGLDLVQAVEPSFSSERLNDLAIEYKDQYPHLRDLLSSFENYPEYYLMSQFKMRLEEAMLNVIDKFGDSFWISSYLNRPTKLIEVLFGIGFVKLFSQKDQQYLAYYETSFLNIDNIQELKIHELFASALKCKR
jgi:hypothetical protein